ncbi:zinc finger protein ubi-d4 B isoform X1 [Halyomorpha halys]|uniref:zinc finger protein ubi-d4 B isoform X1 n=2 Tax=Halyomorpha halys TaxID=286706 RepID=UPI0006D4FDCE|nr:zinc finger protein DPF3 isoform X1 [Halyomorpha halys]
MACDIQVVNPSVLSRIESFMNDTSYREAIENSANYNTRLCIERRMRMPFLDSQTGVAQNHSSLFMSPRERIPGLQHGQVYTYPSKRWRKKRRQYLMQPQVQLRRLEVVPGESVDLHTISTLENPAAANSEDSKDSAGVKDESQVKSQPDAWYYEELELQAMEGFDDADPDSDYDYEETYSKKRKKRGAPGKPAKNTTMSDSPHAKKGPKGTGQGRGRKKGINYSEMGDSEKPFSCDLCGARYKTRPGLTYHYTHSHKEGTSSGGGGGTRAAHEEEQPALPPASPPPPPLDPAPTSGWTKFQDSYLTFLNAPGTNNRRGRSGPQVVPSPAAPSQEEPQPSVPPPQGPQATAVPNPQPEKKLSSLPEQVLIMEQNEKERAPPSAYCDFCLGDAVSNKKSGQPEELLSCSDCGRSGHPTCLQFTDNMIVSVRKYRWQCIECKCCSICGTSDNDDQLLFCDDCDRGYHMYCLAPPLHTPPEGSWSCRLCLIEFHDK